MHRIKRDGIFILVLILVLFGLGIARVIDLLISLLIWMVT